MFESLTKILKPGPARTITTILAVGGVMYAGFQTRGWADNYLKAHTELKEVLEEKHKSYENALEDLATTSKQFGEFMIHQQALNEKTDTRLEYLERSVPQVADVNRKVDKILDKLDDR